MDKEIRKIGIAQFNPYIRLVNRLVSAEHSSHIIPWRILYDFEMIFVTKGKLQVVKEDSSYYINECCLHIMPPFVRHTRIVPEGITTNYFSVHLDFTFDESSPDFSASEVYQVPCNKKLNIVPDNDKLKEERPNYKLDIAEIVESYEVKNKNLFTELFNKLYESYNIGTTSEKLKCKAYLILIFTSFLDDLSLNDAANNNNPDYVSQFIDYAMNHYADNIDLNEIVKEYGISPSRFRAIFKSQMNRAPWEYVIDYRIEQAKKLLLSGKFNTTEVSYMVGYDDIHYFSRLFKQKTGCSLMGYVKKYKQ